VLGHIDALLHVSCHVLALQLVHSHWHILTHHLTVLVTAAAAAAAAAEIGKSADLLGSGYSSSMLCKLEIKQITLNVMQAATVVLSQ
jgi:hypothetical protein